tara:strand:+ start:190 stop:516 length:327 start_codon:yes stop_codon:yes gene_type:complete
VDPEREDKDDEDALSYLKVEYIQVGRMTVGDVHQEDNPEQIQYEYERQVANQASEALVPGSRKGQNAGRHQEEGLETVAPTLDDDAGAPIDAYDITAYGNGIGQYYTA